MCCLLIIPDMALHGTVYKGDIQKWLRGLKHLLRKPRTLPIRNAECWMRGKGLRQICAAPKSNLNNWLVSFQPGKRVTIWKWLEQFWW